MKPTSIIFLILSAILIISGIIICVIAGVIAKNDGIELYVDYMDDAGNAVVEHDLSGKKATDVKIDIKRADVAIITGADRSYIKVENYPTKAYDYWVTDGSINIKDANALSIFTSIRINESGFGFTGLRHYLALGRYKDMPRRVTIYLTKGSILNSVDISVKNGSVTIDGLQVRTDCALAVGEGDVKLTDLTSPGTVKVTCGTGNIIFDKCMMSDTNAEVTEKGDIECEIDMQYSFALKCVSGGVYLDSVKSGSDFSGNYPAEALERKEAPEPEDTAEPADSGSAEDTNKADDKKEETKKDDKKDDKKDGKKDDPSSGEVEAASRMFVGRVKLGDIKIKLASVGE
ncbi:MAG: DUF4097 family beta strand repeat protein [Clostridia bacterium]|nr:DUF4097 family beta strand repeat protein [Clostridia bacterium]